MRRIRLLFTKTGRAKYISHLDLMRTFQRVFLRAGIRLRHTEGFNPHPYMVFALPLPVGCESICELLDFDLPDDTDLDTLPQLLNGTMPEGIAALKAYEPNTKFTDIAFLEIEGVLVYDDGASDSLPESLTSLFQGKELIIPKKTKKGIADTDILPSVSEIAFTVGRRDEIHLKAVITAQNPSLNPDYLIAAVGAHLPACMPQFASFKRLEVLDRTKNVFR